MKLTSKKTNAGFMADNYVLERTEKITDLGCSNRDICDHSYDMNSWIKTKEYFSVNEERTMQFNLESIPQPSNS